MFFIYFVLIINIFVGSIHSISYLLGSPTAAGNLEQPALNILICMGFITIVKEVRKLKK